MSLSDNYCNFCWSNDWQPNGGDNTPVYWKDHSGGPIHVKCYMHIDKNPDSDKVKSWILLDFLDTIDWKKTTEAGLYTENQLKEELMEKKGITQEMINKHLEDKP